MGTTHADVAEHITPLLSELHWLHTVTTARNKTSSRNIGIVTRTMITYNNNCSYKKTNEGSNWCWLNTE